MTAKKDAVKAGITAPVAVVLVALNGFLAALAWKYDGQLLTGFFGLVAIQAAGVLGIKGLSALGLSLKLVQDDKKE